MARQTTKATEKAEQVVDQVTAKVEQVASDVAEKAEQVKAEAIVANTFTTKKELEPYLKYASENKIDVTIFRMENRFGNIHSVPDSTINKMLSRFQSISGEIIIKEKNV